MVGEITPAYSMLEPDMIARVYDLMPNARVIFLMRNSVERVWSQATMSFDKAKKRAIDTAGEGELRRNFGSNGSWLRTDYLRTLGNWISFYPEESILVGFLEDVHFFPEELLRSLYGFLGVDFTFTPSGVAEKVHSRSARRAPMRPIVYLARTHRDDIARLSERFGGYAAFWLQCAERLIDDPPPEEHLLYPPWESSLWEGWLEDCGETPDSPVAGLRSGPLSSL